MRGGILKEKSVFFIFTYSQLTERLTEWKKKVAGRRLNTKKKSAKKVTKENAYRDDEDEKVLNVSIYLTYYTSVFLI